jgi:transposase
VLTDSGGMTGFAIIRAIVAGERDGVKLAQLRNSRCKSSAELIAKALSGDWKAEQLFVLQQSLELYDFYTQQLAACDAQIETQFAAMRPRWQPVVEAPAVPPTKPDSRSKNQPALSTRAELIRLTGVDLVAIKGISTSLAQTIISEIGTDMDRWPTAKHFASCLGLAPHHDISPGKVLRSRTLPTTKRAGQAFRQAPASVTRSRTAFGAFYRRQCAQLGPRQALVATAHKIARTVYHLLKYHVPFEELGATADELKQRERDVAYLRKKAAQFGFTLAQLPVPTTA